MHISIANVSKKNFHVDTMRRRFKDLLSNPRQRIGTGPARGWAGDGDEGAHGEGHEAARTVNEAGGRELGAAPWGMMKGGDG